jgi:hypothetical protein
MEKHGINSQEVWFPCVWAMTNKKENLLLVLLRLLWDDIDKVYGDDDDICNGRSYDS